jgi:hypothetical protein
MLALTATLMLKSSGAGTTTEWLGSAGCTRALCSWSLAFWGLFWLFFPTLPVFSGLRLGII